MDNRCTRYNQVVVHNQRGRLFIKYKGRQINIKEIPVKPDEEDCVLIIFLEVSLKHTHVAQWNTGYIGIEWEIK